jgi:glutamate-1-semialdehyde 2,1-aminomutase
VRPDLCAWSKAIANGYALAAVTGNDRFREAATKIFVTGSFWCGTVAMAAARATLRVAREADVAGHIRTMGLRLREGLAALAKEHDIAIRQSGPPQMPLMLFEADPEVRKGRAFCSAALRHGAFFHPQHNMFLSLAHRPADIDAALQAASYGFLAVRELEAKSDR